MKHFQKIYAIAIALITAIPVNTLYAASLKTNHPSATQQTSQSPSAVAQRLITSIEQDGVFKDVLKTSQQQQLIEVLHRVVERAPRDGDGCDSNGCGTGFTGPCGNSASSDLQVIEQTLCCIKNIIGTPCGSCCVGDACADLQTLFGFLGCLCSKINALTGGSCGSSIELIESKLDLCCKQLNSKLDVVDSTVDVIDSKLDVCCKQLNSKVNIIDSAVDVIDSKLDILLNENACAAVPIGQAYLDAHGGALNPACGLGSTVYCLTEDVTSNISICSDNITLNLNGHIIDGNILITGKDAIIRNGKIIPTSNVGNCITIDNSGASISNCTIDARSTLSSIPTGSNGVTSILINAQDYIIEQCLIYGGPSGQEPELMTATFGGNALDITQGGYNGVINDCILVGGNGSDSPVSNIVTGSGGNGITYAGGEGVLNWISQTTGLNVNRCSIQGGQAGQLLLEGNPEIAADSNTSITLGNGGHGIFSSGILLQINNCTVTAGNGTSITQQNPAGLVGINGGTLATGAGGVGCLLDAPCPTIGDPATVYQQTGFIANDSTFIGGQSGTIFAIGNIGTFNGYVSIPGAGSGIKFICMAGATISRCTAIGGNIGSALTSTDSTPILSTIHAVESQTGSIGITNGSVTIGEPTLGIGEGVAIGHLGGGVHRTIIGTCNTIEIRDSILSGGSLNNTLLSRGSLIDSLEYFIPGNGLNCFATSNAYIVNCTLTGGQGGRIDNVQGDITSSTMSAPGGSGIFGIDVVNLDIANCLINAGSAGDIHARTGGSNNAIPGVGGVGIEIGLGEGVNIRGTAIETTGQGGSLFLGSLTNTIATTGGDGGHGGDGIALQDMQDVLIENCIIDATAGTAGKGQRGGIGGEGIVLNSTSNIIIQNNIIKGTGAGGDTSDSLGSIAGGNGGNGIDVIDSSRIQLLDCTIADLGNGGAGGATPSVTGGSGGAGISVTSGSSTIVIRNVTIDNTGSAGASVSNVHGGDGIFVDSFIDTIDIDNCSINNTGAGAAGGSQGFAINDLATLALIYSNNAYITNGYNIQGTAHDAPNGTPFASAGVNRLENVFAP